MRLALVRAAVADQPGFTVDDREVRRTGLSYSVDTLTELRAEYPDRSLCLLLGMDAFLGLPNWHRWTEILELAHVVVAHRPGWKAPTQGPLGEAMVDRGTGSVRDLHGQHGRPHLRACGDPARDLLDRAAAAARRRPRPALPRPRQRLQRAARDGMLCSAAMTAAKVSRPPARAALVKLVTATLDDMKAVNVRVLDVRKVTDVADYMVLASGNSDRHVRSIADRVVEQAKAAGFRPLGVEGERDGEWVLRRPERRDRPRDAAARARVLRRSSSCGKSRPPRSPARRSAQGQVPGAPRRRPRKARGNAGLRRAASPRAGRARAAARRPSPRRDQAPAARRCADARRARGGGHSACPPGCGKPSTTTRSACAAPARDAGRDSRPASAAAATPARAMADEGKRLLASAAARRPRRAARRARADHAAASSTSQWLGAAPAAGAQPALSRRRTGRLCAASVQQRADERWSLSR